MNDLATIGEVDNSVVESNPDTEARLAQDFFRAVTRSSDHQLESWAHLLLHDAVIARATDIHVEPYEGGARLRFRIDGRMRDAGFISQEVAQQVVNQMKVLARLDPIVSPLPLESRWQESFGDEKTDIRLTAIACHGGEKLHARLLDQGRLNYSLSGLGMSADSCKLVEQWQNARDGMLLVTGPTGAGKTTTLHAVLRHFIESDLNVLTIEDPVEYELSGATQIQVDDTAGMTFAAGIRTMLRLDPDCMLVGELRDPESTEAAMKAAASGHTVLSTVHARNAVGIVPILRQWGVKSGPIATLLSMVVNQRLVPRMCTECRVEEDPNPVAIEWFESRELEPVERIWKATGCDNCNHTGIYGRTGVYEVWKLTEDDRQRIANGEGARSLTSALRKRNHSFLNDSLRAKLDTGEIGFCQFD